MTQAIDKEQIVIDEFRKLSPNKQEEVIDFIQFLQFKEMQKQDVQHKEDKEPISAYEAAKEFAGCVDGGPGDLATNKKYLNY
jgi:ABC-type glycerol-3-phosphate transport system substrate-binding protein